MSSHPSHGFWVSQFYSPLKTHNTIAIFFSATLLYLLYICLLSVKKRKTHTHQKSLVLYHDIIEIINKRVFATRAAVFCWEHQKNIFDKLFEVWETEDRNGVTYNVFQLQLLFNIQLLFIYSFIFGFLYYLLFWRSNLINQNPCNLYKKLNRWSWYQHSNK